MSSFSGGKMRFTYGTTRFVFCVGDIAIKVARIKVLHWVVRLWRRATVTREVASTTTMNTHVKSFARLQLLLVGVVANLEEARMWRKCPNLQAAPTLFSFFGLVNIQVRGTPIESEDLLLCPFRDIATEWGDLKKVQNFVRIDGVLCLADYGHEDLNQLLARFAEFRQVVYNF